MPKVSLRPFSCCWPRSNAIKASIRKSSQRICLTLEDLSLSLAWSDLHVFTMEELKSVTRGFSTSNLIGQGGFGPVFKGSIDAQLWPGLMPQPVAVKLLDLEGSQGHKEWLAEVIILGQLRHPNLVKLIGYCHDERQRLLVYEYMPKGSLESHLFKNSISSLPWLTRLRIAVGAAKGLAFLHDQADKPVIYRDFKSSNILLDENYNAKLSDFGLAKDGPQGNETHVSTRVMGTHGYTAPEYIMTGHLTTKSDVYSFGVVLLELLTGRCSVDKRRPNREKNLVEWAKPFILNPKKVIGIIDERLEGQFSINGAQKAAELVSQCLARSPKSRPNMTTVVETLEPLLELKDIPIGPFIYTVVFENRRDEMKEILQRKDEGLEIKEKVETMKFIGKRHVIGHRHKIKFSHLAFQSHARLYRISSDDYEKKIMLSQE